MCYFIINKVDFGNGGERTQRYIIEKIVRAPSKRAWCSKPFGANELRMNNNIQRNPNIYTNFYFEMRIMLSFIICVCAAEKQVSKHFFFCYYLKPLSEHSTLHIYPVSV